jgi:hypothetical protein
MIEGFSSARPCGRSEKKLAIPVFAAAPTCAVNACKAPVPSQHANLYLIARPANL